MKLVLFSPPRDEATQLPEPSLLEVIASPIPGILCGDKVDVLVNLEEIVVTKT